MAGSNRTQAATHLGPMLKEMRESRGVSLRKLAEMMGRKSSDSGLISRWETGERSPKPDDVAQLIEALGVEGDDAVKLMAAATGGEHGTFLAVSVPERRQQLNELIAAERTATLVTHVAPLSIPGVLQTSDVIRQIMIAGGAPAGEIDERVTMRLGRRDLITRRNPAQLDVLLGETAIRTVIGSPQLWVDQLSYLLEMGEYPNVTIRGLPYELGWTKAQIGSFILLESDIEPPIVSLDLHRSGLMLRDSEDVAGYREDADELREKAISPAATAELIAKVINELERSNDDTA